MAIKKTIEIDVTAPNAQQNINAVTSSLDKASKSSDSLNKTLSTDKGAGKFKGLKDSIGGIVPAFDTASQGASAFNKQLLVLLANPIGLVIAAIVLAVAGLVSIFKSFTPVVDKVEQGLSALSAVATTIKNTFIAVFTGTKSLTDAFSGLGGSMSTAANEAIRLTKAQQDLDDALQAQDITVSKLDSQINKLNVQARNRNLTEAESLALLKKSENLQKSKLNLLIQNADKEVLLARDRIANAANLTKEERKQLKEQGFAYKEFVESRTTDVDELFEALKKAQINRNNIENEATAQLEKNQNKQDAIAEKEKAKEEATETKRKERIEKANEAERKLIEEKLKDQKLSFQQQRDLVNSDNKLALKDKKEFLKKINDEEEKSIEEHKKALLDLENKYKIDIENLNAKTEQDRLNLQKSRDLKEIENVVKTEEEKARLKLSLDEKYKILQAELDDKTAKEKEEKQKVINDKKIADEKAVADAKVAIQLQALNALGDLVGLAKSIGEKNKGLQRAALIAESAIGISKIIINTQAANSAARLKYALLPGGAALAATESLLNKVSAGIGIAANVAATAKGLSALGGGGATGGGGSNPASGGGGGSSAPQFNLVGQSSTNQLSQTIANQQKQPIKTYVVAGDVTTQQGLDRNAVQTSTFGG